MNAYGDSHSPRGWGSEPADGEDHGSGNGHSTYGTGHPGAGAGDGSGGRAGAAYGPGGAAVGGAPVGRARVGRASVPVPGSGYHEGGYRPGGSAAVGAAPVGAASVGAPPARPATGRATVGRATVRPVSPAVGGAGGVGQGVGGTGASGGATRPPGRRPRLAPAGAAKRRRRRRINWIIASFAVLVMLAGGGVVGFTYYSTTVQLPNEIDLDLSSTIMYADGKTQIARLGTVNRTLVKIDQIPDHVEYAVASAEDRNFYEHDGIDYLGIMRAAWNNVSGGDQQGASTITQQYARNALNLQGVTYGRKVREAVLASKLNDRYSKPEIMEHYLNTIYFGRGAYSVESAAQAYFRKSASKLTVEEGAVLAGVIKQPVPSATHKGYDPALNKQAAMDRWAYVLDGMVQKGWLDPAKRVTMKFPKVQPWNEKSACVTECGFNTPVGNVVNYVKTELVELGLCPNETACMEALRTGGYRVTTSIDRKMQATAEKLTRRAVKNSLLNKQNKQTKKGKEVVAAMAAVDPATGRVLAYYGGDTGSGFDFAGRNLEKGALVGGRAPGSSFKVYTLAAALENGISLQSHWDARTDTPEARKHKLSNANRTPPCASWCSLEYSLIQSYNVPFWYITDKIGIDKVLDVAKRAGVEMMWDDAGKPYNLTKEKLEKLAGPVFFNQIGFGQYGVTVLEHANGMATFANRGVYNKAHFVVKVEQKDRTTGKWERVGDEIRKPQERFRKQVVDDMNHALQKVSVSHSLAGGRAAARKTGTWERGNGSNENSDLWMAGYTPQVATAVWVGAANARIGVKNIWGGNMQSHELPSDIWQAFMNEAHEGKEQKQFNPPAYVGEDDAGNGASPSPKPPREPGRDPRCRLFPRLCPDQPGGDERDGNRDRGGDQPPVITPPSPISPRMSGSP